MNKKLTAHEKAILTYKALQERKSKKERNKDKIYFEYAANCYDRIYRRCRTENSRGYVQKKYKF